MASSYFYGHSPLAGLFKRDFSYSCVAVDKISADFRRRAVPLRWLSLLHARTVCSDIMSVGSWLQRYQHVLPAPACTLERLQWRHLGGGGWRDLGTLSILKLKILG